MTFEFNIVYTPGSVQNLTPFLRSLLRWSDCTYRLVSNGCFPPEQRYLKSLCRSNNRLSYLTIPTKSVLPHGQALNQLQAMTVNRYFCFMDSDILVSGDFMAQAAARLNGRAGFFSGAPVWAAAKDGLIPDSYQVMSGLHNRTESGLCLGGTFFAIYDNEALDAFIQESGVGFDEYRYGEAPPYLQNRLNELGLKKASYDTSKLLLILMQDQGAEMVYEEIPCLHHIGGASFHAMRPGGPASFMGRLVEKIGGINGRMRDIVYRLRARRAYGEFRKFSREEFLAVESQRLRQRDPVRKYFYGLLDALLKDLEPPPAPEIGIAEIDLKVRGCAREIFALFQNIENEGGRGRGA